MSKKSKLLRGVALVVVLCILGVLGWYAYTNRHVIASAVRLIGRSAQAQIEKYLPRKKVVDGYALVPPHEFDQRLQEAQKLKNNVLLLDVRTPEEFKQGHIPGAININVFDAEFVKKVQEYIDQLKAQDPKAPVVLFVYCKGGARSKKATTMLYKAGIRDMVELDGGIMAWQKAGLPVVKIEPQPECGK